MRNSVKCLCILILTCYCDGEWSLSMQELEENLKIDIPENCSVISTLPFEAYVECSDFSMNFTTKNIYEYSTIIRCTHSSYLHEYLRNANSNRNSLTLWNCPAPKSGTFGRGWPSLEYLIVISHENDLQLKREQFSGLNNLWYLELSTTQIIPDDMFADLPKLRTIKMSVEHVNKKLFANLNELVSLQLTIRSREILNNFDTSELKSAPKFNELKLYYNNFSNLSKRFFEGCSNIEHLEMRFNTIETFDFDAFEPLTNLKRIAMDHNEISALPAELFSKNKKLEIVRIFAEFNKILPMPPGILSNLQSLEEVEINCNLISVPSDLIHGSNNLQRLDLEFNQLTSLPRDFFQNHSKLRVVGLYGNNFSEIPFPNYYFKNKSPLTKLKFT